MEDSATLAAVDTAAARSADELAARAFAAAGMPDSARAHAAWLACAWRAADSPFRARAVAGLGY